MADIMEYFLPQMPHGEYILKKECHTKIIELLDNTSENINTGSRLGLRITGIHYLHFRRSNHIVWEIPAGEKVYFEGDIDYRNNKLIFKYKDMHFQIPVEDLTNGKCNLVFKGDNSKENNQEGLIMHNFKKGSLAYLKEKKDDTLGVVLELLDEEKVILLYFADRSFKVVSTEELLNCDGGIDRGVNAFINNLQYIAELSKEQSDLYKSRYMSFLFDSNNFITYESNSRRRSNATSSTSSTISFSYI